ncbi:MAG: polyprenyl diphosphate synthase [Bdellovibrionota bacterium]
MTFRPPIVDPAHDRKVFPRLPRHIAIIMDGNGRWAKQRGYHRIRGHWEGARRVDEITTECARLGVEYLTLYAFSTENWNRPESEVSMLMRILVHYLKAMEKKLVRERVALAAQGTLDRLPEKVQKSLFHVMQLTSEFEPRMVLNLSLSYGGRTEILDSAKELARRALAGELNLEKLSEEEFRKSLYQPEIPDPDLLIRSGGEFRISNFLLWQAAYAELYITDTLWPDFGPEALHKAITEYGERERRFGKTSEQVAPSRPEQGLS